MTLSGWQHISQTLVVLVGESELELESELLLLLLSALVEESELLLKDVAADAATLCEHLHLVLREDLQSSSCLGPADAATLSEDLHLELREDVQPCSADALSEALHLAISKSLTPRPAAPDAAAVDGSESRCGKCDR